MFSGVNFIVWNIGNILVDIVCSAPTSFEVVNIVNTTAV